MNQIMGDCGMCGAGAAPAYWNVVVSHYGSWTECPRCGAPRDMVPEPEPTPATEPEPDLCQYCNCGAI